MLNIATTKRILKEYAWISKPLFRVFKSFRNNCLDYDAKICAYMYTANKIDIKPIPTTTATLTGENDLKYIDNNI